jgi:DNA polymerase-3 subunit delta'
LSLLPWHEPARRLVEETIAAGRLPHALLVRGAEGWGELVFAAWLARRLLGMENTDVAREAAENVAALRSLAHPDLRWIGPDGAVIKVDEVRRLREFSVGTRQSAPCKVAVIEQAELLNVNAANALLKTLEEPPPGTHLILTTCQPGRLLPTIVSRCQAVVLRADASLARDWLVERWDPGVVDERLVEYGFAPLAVDQALAEQEAPLLPLLETLARRQGFAPEMQALLALNPERLLGRWYRCCVALAGSEPPAGWTAAVSAGALADFVDELVSVRRQILSSNSANTRLLLERLASRWRRVVPSRAA